MPIAGRYLGILGAVLQVCLCILLFRRKMHQRLPFFSAYTIFSIVSETGSTLLYQHYALYFKFYWISETFYVILGFLAIREVFHWVFRNFYGIFWFRFIFPIVGILMLALAAVRSMLLPTAHLQKLIAAIISL